MEAASHPWPTLGVLLLRDGLVTTEDLDGVLATQHDTRRTRISGSRLGELLVERGLVTPEQVARAVAEQYELPFVELEKAEIDLDVASRFDEGLARRYSALPIEALAGAGLLVAVADPATVLFAEDLRSALGMPLRFAIAAPTAMEAALKMVFSGDHVLGAPEGTERTNDDVDFEPTEIDQHASVGRVATSAQTRPPLGALLLRDGVITETELHAALAQQRLTADKRLGEILVEREIVMPADIARVVAEQHELPFVDLVGREVDLEAARLLPLELGLHHGAVPVDFDADGRLRVAIADPGKALYSDDLRSALGMPLTFVVVAADAIDEALAFVHAVGATQVEADRTMASEFGSTATLEPAPTSDAFAPGEEPRAKPAREETLTEARGLVQRALLRGATSLHVSPRPDGLRVRARIDGTLQELETVPSARPTHLVESLEALESVDLDGSTVELDVHTLPTRHGKRLTVRPRPLPSAPPVLAELELPVDVEEALRTALDRASGAILVCGSPQGERTATLHALLAEVAANRIVLTVEDGLEYLAPRADQIEIAALVDPTFASGVRAAVRLDPDVLLVGELEDRETARLALEAATEGRLVLAGLRAASARGAHDRLVELGIDRELVAAAVGCVVAQRTLPRICPTCRESYYARPDELVLLQREPAEAGRRLLARGKGCVECRETGLRGHVSAHEALEESDAADTRLLAGDAVRLCLEGITTADEVRRVLGV